MSTLLILKIYSLKIGVFSRLLVSRNKKSNFRFFLKDLLTHSVHTLAHRYSKS